MNTTEPPGPAQVGARTPCPVCGAMIIVGARKCKACRSWLVDPPRGRLLPRGYRGLTLILAAVLAVGAVLVSQRKSPVGEAPPLTPINDEGSAVVTAQVAPQPAGAAPNGSTAAGAHEVNSQDDPLPEGGSSRWRTRSIDLDVHPLDIVFHPSGQSLYVSGNDATLWEYDLENGKVLHMATLPAQGDRLRLLNHRYLAIIRHHDAGHIPLLDTQHWERDPKLLYVGANPADIIALPDGKTAVAASSRGKRLSSFDLATGRRQSGIRLPHATRHLFLLRSEDRTYVGAMGLLVRAGDPAGAWMDIFDPSETPFGATRRSISVGRDPRPGAVAFDGAALFFADRVSNVATLLRIEEATEARSVAVGQSPEGAFVLGRDRYGVTLNSQARTATVVELNDMDRTRTLMLAGSPRGGATAKDGQTLFISLGGTAWPPVGTGAAVIAGEPPKVVATFETDKGASRVAVAPDGRLAAVATYWGKTVTLIERAGSEDE